MNRKAVYVGGPLHGRVTTASSCVLNGYIYYDHFRVDALPDDDDVNERCVWAIFMHRSLPPTEARKLAVMSIDLPPEVLQETLLRIAIPF